MVDSSLNPLEVLVQTTLPVYMESVLSQSFPLRKDAEFFPVFDCAMHSVLYVCPDHLDKLHLCLYENLFLKAALY